MAYDWKELQGSRVISDHTSGGAPYYRQWDITFTGSDTSTDPVGGEAYATLRGTTGDLLASTTGYDGQPLAEVISERKATKGGKYHIRILFRSYYVVA